MSTATEKPKTTAIEKKKSAAPAFKPQAITYPVIAEQIDQWRQEFTGLAIAGVEDKEGYLAVHKARMTIKNARVAVDKRRKELKADALKYGNEVDAAAKAIVAELEPLELSLQQEQDRIDSEKARIKREADEKRRQEIQGRVDALLAVGCRVAFAAAEAMQQDAYDKLLAEATKTYQEAQAKAAADEAERKRIEAERVEQQRIEAERLAAERAELDRQRAEQEAIRQAQEEANRAAAAELEKRAAELEAEKRRLFEEQEAKRRAEELERTRQEAAERARIEAEERVRREQAEATAKAQAEEEARQRAEALRPSREKIVAFSRTVGDMTLVALPDQPVWIRQRARKILHAASIQIAQLADELDLVTAAVEESEQ